MRSNKRGKLKDVVIKLFVCTLAIIFLVPVLLTVVQSFQVDSKISLDGYRELLFNCFPFYHMFWNSVLYTMSITIGIILISVPAAFAFKFAHFRGKNVLYVIYIILMMMPLQVMLLPNYIGLRDMELLNTRLAIILPMLFSPFGVVVIHQYMREIDTSMIEAARLETNSVIRIMFHCIIPQIKVCIAAAALFLFADAWNMVEQPLLYVNEDKLRTLSAFIAQAKNYTEGVMLPASVLFIIPVFLCYLMFHEELKEGLKL